LSKRNLIIGLDPGTTKSGWAIYDPDAETVIDTGHDAWADVRDKIKLYAGKARAVVVEQVIIHHGVPGQSKYIMDTAHEVGRIQQICEDNGIIYSQLPRIDICERVTGRRPTRGHKVSKKDMQDAVQKKLKVDKPIRPQHANDAVAVILAEYPPNAQAEEEKE